MTPNQTPDSTKPDAAERERLMEVLRNAAVAQRGIHYESSDYMKIRALLAADGKAGGEVVHYKDGTSFLVRPQRAAQQPLTDAELELCRQWFDNVQDMNAVFLEKADYLLAEKLYQHLGMRVTSSIKAGSQKEQP